MNILLIMADGRIHRIRLAGHSISLREAPLTLTTLAALVPPELDASIRIVDESVESVPFDETPDVVGISCLTGTAPRAYVIADRFRARGCTVVLGGVHVSLLPEEARQHADAIVIGAAEETWPALLRDVAAGTLKPVYQAPPGSLAGLPRPRRDLQRPLAYMMPNTVQATRGCDGTCGFCTVPALGWKWQTRPVAEVIDDIRQIPSRRFALNDVSLTTDREYARELFTALAPLKKKWGGLCTTRIGQDDELLDLMVRSGCIFLLIGFESFNAKSLGGTAKAFNRPADYRVLLDKLHGHGIIVQGCFVFGFDQDDTSVFGATVDQVTELGVDIPRYAIYTPYPGTAAYAELAAQGRLLHRNWEYYDTHHVVFQPARMSVKELTEGFHWAYCQTYSLRSTIRRLAKSRHPLVTGIGNLAYRMYLRRLRNEGTAG